MTVKGEVPDMKFRLNISSGGPGLGLGQAEMSITYTPDRLTGTVWNKKIAELDATQEPLAARAACWLAICSFIFSCISLGVGCAMWVATIQV
jgi:hypothetical protein